MTPITRHMNCTSGGDDHPEQLLRSMEGDSVCVRSTHVNSSGPDPRQEKRCPSKLMHSFPI
jgi:hypothetical protein